MACVAASKNYFTVCSRDRLITTSWSGKVLLKYDLKNDDLETRKQTKETNGLSNASQGNEDLFVVDCAFSPNEKYFGICTSSKLLLIWDTSSWNLVCIRDVLRRPMKLVFSHQDIPVIADKTGDVYRIHWENDKLEHIIGHLSVILDMIITSDGKEIVTSDRDGKIRISCYPNCYNINSFLMAHESFVPSFVLDCSEKYLVSIDGDGNMFLWNKKENRLCDAAKLPTEEGIVPRKICVNRENSIFVILNGVKKVFHYEMKEEKLKELEELVLTNVPLDIQCNGSDILVLQNSKQEAVVTFHLDQDKKLLKTKLEYLSEMQEYIEEPLILEPWKCQAWADTQEQ